MSCVPVPTSMQSILIVSILLHGSYGPLDLPAQAAKGIDGLRVCLQGLVGLQLFRGHPRRAGASDILTSVARPINRHPVRLSSNETLYLQLAFLTNCDLDL